MSERIEVRHYDDADREAVVALWRAVFPSDSLRNDPAHIIDSKLWVDGLLFVAAASGVIAGAALAGWDGHRGWLYHVAVDPAYRRRGVGRALVSHIVEVLAAQGYLKVNLQIMPFNDAVIPFYEALGFRVEERVSMGQALESASPTVARRV